MVGRLKSASSANCCWLNFRPLRNKRKCSPKAATVAGFFTAPKDRRNFNLIRIVSDTLSGYGYSFFFLTFFGFPMKKLPVFPVLLLAALALAACEKDRPEASLPAATQEGKNTAGCLINGQPFVAQAYGGDILSPPIKAMEGGFYFDSLYYLTLNGKLNGQAISVTLFLRQPKVGTFLLNKNTRFYPQGSPLYVLNHATYSVSDNSHEVYVTNARHTGQVVLTKANKATDLSAGTFSFTALSNQDSARTVTITSGRFDWKE